MKTELRLSPHYVVNGQFVVEVIHDGVLVATIVGAEGSGVRVLSKHRVTALLPSEPGVSMSTRGNRVNVVHVMIGE